MDEGGLVGYSFCGRRESDTTGSDFYFTLPVTHTIFCFIPYGDFYYHAHFMDEETEVPECELACLGLLLVCPPSLHTHVQMLSEIGLEIPTPPQWCLLCRGC